MTLELTEGEEFDDLLEELFEGDLEYLIGWSIEVERGARERMRLLKKGPVWTQDDEYNQRVVIVSASVLDPATDHSISISVQVTDIPKDLTGKDAITYALMEIVRQEIK